jgi:hypothetical protein
LVWASLRGLAQLCTSETHHYRIEGGERENERERERERERGREREGERERQKDNEIGLPGFLSG